MVTLDFYVTNFIGRGGKSGVPVADPLIKKNRLLSKGEVPSAMHPPPGCHFHPRCPERIENAVRRFQYSERLGLNIGWPAIEYELPDMYCWI